MSGLRMIVNIDGEDVPLTNPEQIRRYVEHLAGATGSYTPGAPTFDSWMPTVEPTYQQWTAHSIKIRRDLQAAIELWKAGK